MQFIAKRAIRSTAAINFVDITFSALFNCADLYIILSDLSDNVVFFCNIIPKVSKSLIGLYQVDSATRSIYITIRIIRMGINSSLSYVITLSSTELIEISTRKNIIYSFTSLNPTTLQFPSTNG